MDAGPSAEGAKAPAPRDQVPELGGRRRAMTPAKTKTANPNTTTITPNGVRGDVSPAVGPKMPGRLSQATLR